MKPIDKKRVGILSIAVSSLLTLPLQAWSGDKVGNGGGAWVCVDEKGDIRSAELLDLREAAIENPSLQIVRTDRPRDEQTEEKLAELAGYDAGLAVQVRRAMDRIRWREVADSDRYQLVPPSDTALRVIRREKGCSLQGVASYDDTTDVVTFDPEIFGAMPPTDQSALMIHEAFYKVMRSKPFLARDSRHVRSFIGALYSDRGLSPVSPDYGKEHARFECRSEGYRFFIIPLSQDDVRLQFTEIEHRQLTDRTYVDLNAGAGEDNHPDRGDRAELRRRALNGFAPSTRKLRPRCNWHQRWIGKCDDRWNSTSHDMTLRTRSNLEPSYTFILRAYDRTTPFSDPVKTGTTSVFNGPYLHKNAQLNIVMPGAGSFDAGASITCGEVR